MLKFAKKIQIDKKRRQANIVGCNLNVGIRQKKNERQSVIWFQIQQSADWKKKQCDWVQEINSAKNRRESHMHGFDWLQQITNWQRKKGNQYDWVQLAFSLWFFSEGILAEARKTLTSCGNGSQLTIDHLQWQWQWQWQATPLAVAIKMAIAKVMAIAMAMATTMAFVSESCSSCNS